MIRLFRRVTARSAASAGADAVRMVALGYAGQMALGFALLSLPFAQGAPVSPLDVLFVAVSAVSTTGLSPVDFHSVSAFCTAGFSLFADSLVGFNADAPVLVAISILSVLGAIGFLVAGETWDRLRGRQRRLSISARVILAMTAATIGLGIVVLALTEPLITAMPPGARLLNAFFQAMTAATTVGFNAIPTDGIAHLSVMVTYVPMLIGASPSGTGGGLKSTAVATQWAFMLAVLRGREEVTLFGVAVPPAKLRQAIASFFMAATVLTVAMFPLVATETLDFERLLFEAISALGTVGLSLGATAELTDAGKAVISVVMYVGRVGVLAFGVALALRQRRDHVIPRREDLAI
jgi:trk system potassium uptake protein TrkH